MSSSKSTNSDLAEGHEEHNTVETKKWYRSSMFNACVIGMVGFMVSKALKPRLPTMREVVYDGRTKLIIPKGARIVECYELSGSWRLVGVAFQ